MLLQAMNNFKINHIVLGFIIISVLMLGSALAFINNNFTKMEQNWETFKETISTKQTLVSKMEVELGFEGAIHHFKNYVIRGDEKFVQSFEKSKSKLESYIQEFRSFNLNELEVQAVNQLQTLLNYIDSEIEYVRQAHADGVIVSEIDRPNPNDTAIKSDFLKLSSFYDKRSKELFDERDAVRSSSEIAMFASGGVILLLMLLLKLITDYKIIKPLKIGNKAVMAIAEGDYSTEIKSKAKDEIGKTLRYIEKMRVSLQKSVGEIEEALKESSTLSSTMEGLGTNVLITNIDEELVYANKQSVNNLENLTPDIRQTFPDFDVNKLMGSSIHQFHKDPSRIKTILNNLKPGQQHKAIISIGDIKLSLNAGGVFNSDGEKLGYYVEWQDVTQQHALENQIQAIANSINTATGDISQGNQNLSERTESQAASIQETTASMQQITERVNETANSAKEAASLSNNTKSAADKGGKVVKTAIQAMQEISQSSKKINEIISVIDEIAFQTNLLALNAAVEAARAGEQGRGFAVVASEVRSLAGRSATAAKEIKELITDSVNKVESGSMQVNETGECLDEIIMSVQEVTRMVNSITQATSDQASGIDEINRAITQMDSFTQQNASLVEEAASASESLKEQSDSLVKVIKKDQEMQN